ncbi:metal-dependent hydrolase family protein [Occultella kanbiaonis]|uniref:metal-dependent hydrolase family protein n=1 Tax=Occultella kanbiaonis TaxID=2675754 RepID=UPI0012B7B510|nr:amidohydrolase family protein [Occultella kanbiaonis]
MFVLIADRVLAGPDLEVINGGAVIIEDDRIVWVGREADLSADQYPPDADVRWLGDVTLMPGLIDAHVHLAFDGSPHPVARMMAESDEQQVALMLRSARELLSVGVTTARDLGARGYTDVVVRDAIANGTARGPRLLTAGGAITTTGGHCWFMGAEADGIDEVRKMVRRHHKAGVDVIKLMSTGGNMTPGSAPWHAQFTTDELRAAVDEAHRLGKRVAAHAHGTEGIRRALDAGVDTMEHCSFQTEDGMGGADPELADRIAASEIYVSPTCNFRMREFRVLMKGRDFALGELYRRGAKIIASTDAGIDNTPHHGFVGGLVAMSEFDIPIAQVLLSATSRSAHALGLADRTGQLAAGFEADLIAVAGDPRTDLRALDELRLVLARGQEFTPDALPAIEPLPEDFLPMSMRSMLEHDHGGTGSDPGAVAAMAEPAALVR